MHTNLDMKDIKLLHSKPKSKPIEPKLLAPKLSKSEETNLVSSTTSVAFERAMMKFDSFTSSPG